MKVRTDANGLYIRSRWYSVDKGSAAYRPGTFPGYSHALDTSDGGLSAGDNPKTRHVSGAPLVAITLESGQIIYWGSYDRIEGDFPEGAKA